MPTLEEAHMRTLQTTVVTRILRITESGMGAPHRKAIVLFLLLLLEIAVFQKAAWFVPADGDDLRILSSVSQTSNPFSYFVQDWGMAGTYRLASGELDLRRQSYRPLHSISIWVGYKLFGVWAKPNQLLNLLLHFTNVVLLARILSRIRPNDPSLVFLLSGLALVSMYTASPATWVSDRETLIVALSTLLLIDHFVSSTGELSSTLNVRLLTILTLLAVMTKESGIVIPLVAAMRIWFLPYAGPRWRHFLVSISLVGAYIGWRLFLFGWSANSYSAEGYVYGARFYDDLASLPPATHIWAVFENIFKNCAAVFLPIFNWGGGIQAPRDLLWGLPSWLPILLLTMAATQRPLTAIQRLALIVIVANALVHAQVFRYRIHYLSEFAFCLFVVASPLMEPAKSWMTPIGRNRLLLGCAGLALLANTWQVNNYVHRTWIDKFEELTEHHLSTITAKYPTISTDIVNQVLILYDNQRARGP
jgi:hypothetical protein